MIHNRSMLRFLLQYMVRTRLIRLTCSTKLYAAGNDPILLISDTFNKEVTWESVPAKLNLARLHFASCRPTCLQSLVVGALLETRADVPVEIHCFHLKKSRLQLKDALASGPCKSLNLSLKC